jgi:hypothetical protein
MNLYVGTLLHIHITGFTNGTVLFVSVGSGWLVCVCIYMSFSVSFVPVITINVKEQVCI